jgi:hypothetical protein
VVDEGGLSAELVQICWYGIKVIIYIRQNGLLYYDG